MPRENIKTFKSFMHIAISNEGTFFGSKGELSLVIGVKIRRTCAPKNMKKGVVWLDFIKAFKRALVVNDFAWSPINEICSSEEGFIPKLKGHGCFS
jgi:hypothetical protein